MLLFTGLGFVTLAPLVSLFSPHDSHSSGRSCYQKRASILSPFLRLLLAPSYLLEFQYSTLLVAVAHH